MKKNLVKQKILSVVLVLLTIPVLILDGDATATVLFSMMCVPMFFTKRVFIL